MPDKSNGVSGTKKELRIPVEAYPPLHCTVISGAYPGKRLVITAGVHGGEYVGILAAEELIRELDPSVMHGEVTILPIVNESGFYHGAKQVVPEDGVNLNRAFPGDRTKSAAWRIAAAVEEHLYSRADFLADLHSGDINEGLVPLVFFPVSSGKAVEEAARAAAKIMGVSYRVPSTSVNGLYSQAAQKGIPALLVEGGCRGQWSPKEVTACKRDMYRLMIHLGILEEENTGGKPDWQEKTMVSPIVQVELDKTCYVEADGDGFWFPNVKEGEQIKKGSLLGELKSRKGEQIRQYAAEFDGVVLYYTVSLGVREGDPLVAYGRSDDKDLGI